MRFPMLIILTLFGLFGCNKEKRFLQPEKHQSNVKGQLAGNKKILQQLSLMGVTQESKLSLEYFFYTDTQAKASALNDAIQRLGYDKLKVDSANALWVVTGWTTKQIMRPDAVDQWTRDMCELGFKHDCEFDGWGTYPDQEEVSLEEGLSVSQYYDLALSTYNEGDLIRSEAYFSKAISMEPEGFPDAYFNRGNVRDQRGNKLGALEDYDKAIAMASDFAEAYENRGATKDELGDYEGAIADYNKALEYLPESAMAYFNRGNTNYRLGRKDEACMDWAKAKELGMADAAHRLSELCGTN